MDLTNLAIAANIIDELVDKADGSGDISFSDAREVLSQYFDEKQVNFFLSDDLTKVDSLVEAAKGSDNYPIVKLLFNQLKKAEKKLKEKQNV